MDKELSKGQKDFREIKNIKNLTKIRKQIQKKFI